MIVSMSTSFLGIIVGGLVPLFCFGASGVLNKLAAQANVGVASLLFFTGIGAAAASLPFLLQERMVSFGLKGTLYSFLMGFLWGLGVGFVTFAIQRFQTPYSRLVPIFNMNTLIVVLVTLWLFAEWKEVKTVQLFLGTLFIVIGGTLVALA